MLGCRQPDAWVAEIVAGLPGDGHWAVLLPVDVTAAVDAAATPVTARHPAVQAAASLTTGSVVLVDGGWHL